MNILQADLQVPQINGSQSPPVETPDVSLKSGDASDDFPLLFESHFNDVASSENSLQTIEIKELISNPELINVEFEIPEYNASLQQPWLEPLENTDVIFTTDTDPLKLTTADPASLELNLQNNTVVHADPLVPVITNSVSLNGELLPVGGNNLPSVVVVNGALASQEWLDANRNRGAQNRPPLDIAATTKDAIEVLQEKIQGPKNELSTPANLRSNRPSDLEVTSQTDKLATSQADKSTTFQADKITDSIVAKLHGPQNNHQMVDAGISRLQPNVGAMSSVANLQPVLSTSLELEQLSIAKPENVSEWGKGLGDRVSWMINQKLNSASVRLDPPMLGKLEVHIQVRDDITSITINTQHAQTRDMIENASFRLREHLQEAGFENVNVDVSHGHGKNQPDTEHLADSSESSASEAEITEQTDKDVDQLTADNYSSDSLVDYFA